jgi:hypothetical protein
MGGDLLVIAWFGAELIELDILGADEPPVSR